jgi:hypothetical protein
VDGSAHLLGDHGLIVLFNSDGAEHTAEFALSRESTGFVGSKPVEVTQEYPAGDRRESCKPGAPIGWSVPAESAVVLRLNPSP